jgi:hypothetical protein
VTQQPHTNEGIVVSGNASVTDSALAAGAGASATVHHRHPGAAAQAAEAAQATEAALAAIAELTRRLDRMEQSGDPSLTPEQRQSARDEARGIQQDLADDAPTDHVRGRLARLKSFVAEAAALLGLVASADASLRAITGG